MVKKKDGISLFNFLQQRMHYYRQQGDNRAAKMLALLNRLKGFRADVDIALGDVDAEFVRGFSGYLHDEGLAANTVGFYLRYFRAEYNIAAKDGVVENARPFAGVKMEKVPAEKRALAMSDIMAIKNLDLSRKKSLALARDMFMFSFYAQGMELVDMAYLNMGNIRNGQIVFKRRRSGQQESVAWIPEMQAIIDRYPGNPAGYLLPIIDGKKDQAPDVRFRLRAQCIAINLKKVARLANIHTPVTPDIARVTWFGLLDAAIEQAKMRLLGQVGA